MTLRRRRVWRAPRSTHFPIWATQPKHCVLPHVRGSSRYEIVHRVLLQLKRRVYLLRQCIHAQNEATCEARSAQDHAQSLN
jgi:hypothetical protein